MFPIETSGPLNVFIDDDMTINLQGYEIDLQVRTDEGEIRVYEVHRDTGSQRCIYHRRSV